MKHASTFLNAIFKLKEIFRITANHLGKVTQRPHFPFITLAYVVILLRVKFSFMLKSFEQSVFFCVHEQISY